MMSWKKLNFKCVRRTFFVACDIALTFFTRMKEERVEFCFVWSGSLSFHELFWHEFFVAVMSQAKSSLNYIQFWLKYWPLSKQFINKFNHSKARKLNEKEEKSASQAKTKFNSMINNSIAQSEWTEMSIEVPFSFCFCLFFFFFVSSFSIVDDTFHPTFAVHIKSDIFFFKLNSPFFDCHKISNEIHFRSKCWM